MDDSYPGKSSHEGLFQPIRQKEYYNRFYIYGHAIRQKLHQ